MESTNTENMQPVYLVINDLSKEYRYDISFMIPTLVYCGKTMPNMLTFLNPLTEKLNNKFYLEDCHLTQLHMIQTCPVVSCQC